MHVASRRGTMAIDYGSKIPNNVELAGDKQLKRALEQWQPHFLEWWKEMGPVESRTWDVY